MGWWLLIARVTFYERAKRNTELIQAFTAAEDVMRNRANLNSRRVAALMLLGCPATAFAQVTQTMASPVSTSCIDRLPPSVFTRVAVYASINLRDSASASFAQSADNFLQEVVIKVQRLLGASGDKLPAGEPAVNWRGVDAWLHLAAYKDGRIVVVDRDSATRPMTTSALFVRALDSMSTVGELEWSADSARDSIRFDIAFVRPLLDSAGQVTKATSERQAVPVFSILAPWERHAALKPGQSPPSYPMGPLRRRYEAKLLLNFIIDSTGHAVPSTIKDLWPDDKPRLTGQDLSAYQSFLEETERALTKMEFIPALIGGCAVRQLVQMPFVFTIGR